MKKLQFLIYLVSFYSFAADDDHISAKISKVTIFQNQAQITSTVKGFVKAGTNTLIIENVSPNLNSQTIQVAGKGDFILMGTKFSNNFIGESKTSPKLIQLTDSLRYINDELRMIAFNLEALEREKDLLKANYLTSATTVANTADKVKAMADFFRIRMADINSNIIKNERMVISFKEKSVKIQLQINELNEKKNIPSGEIAINISSKTRTAIELEITYIVNGAGWSPVYDIRVKDVKSPISLAYKANVWQQTGLDWNDVKLTLSTSNPSMGGNKPELYPQFVDVYVPMPPVPVYQKNSRAMDNEIQGRVAGVAVMDAGSSADFTTVSENTLAVNFEIELPYTIPNGGKSEIVAIQNYDLPADFKHFGLPKYDADAFLTANITGWEQYNLMTGKANVYFEGAFVGETNILNNNVKDTLNLSLGRDKKINFKREIIREFSSKKAIGSNIRESQAYRIIIRNTKKEAVDLVVEDQIPVSKSSDIEVLDAEYKGAEWDMETGKLTWKLNLKPSETKIIEVKYTVKYPKGKTITGI